jgi:ABC-type spermidine/putrescine transport system permease subunit I
LNQTPRAVPAIAVAAALPVLIVFGACMVWVAVLSVFTSDPYALFTSGFSLDNYAEALTGRLYRGALEQSVELALAATVLTALAGYPLACHIAGSRGRRKGAYVAVVVSVFLVTFVIKIYAWQILLAEGGPIDQALRALHLADTPLHLLGTAYGVLIGLVYASLPYMVLVLIASIEQVPAELENAAACYGAPPAKVFLLVTLPLTMPGLLTGMIFTFAFSLAAYVVPALLGAGKVQMSALLIQTISAGAGTGGADWPLAAALSMVLLLVSAACAAAALRAFTGRRWRLT